MARMKCVDGVYMEMTPEEEAQIELDTAAFAAEKERAKNIIISDRQFAHALALMGMITKDEAIEWVSMGTIPYEFKMKIENDIQDEDVKFAATMLLAGATTFERLHPMVEVFRTLLGYTSDQIDYIFSVASTL